MNDKRYHLYTDIQIDAGAVSHHLRKCKSELETGSLNEKALLSLCDSMIKTADDLAVLISKTAQLIFSK